VKVTSRLVQILTPHIGPRVERPNCCPLDHSEVNFTQSIKNIPERETKGMSITADRISTFPGNLVEDTTKPIVKTPARTPSFRTQAL